MCDPVSMFAAATIGTTALSAAGSIMQGKQAAAMGAMQRQAYQQQADDTRLAAGYEATREFEKGRKVQAHALTQIAASGVELAGSPTEALVENAKQSALDIESIQFGSQIKQNQLNTQGELAYIMGQQKKQAGYISAATTAVSGISQLYAPKNSVRMGGGSFS